MIELTIIGNLGADAIINDAPKGKVINFAICRADTLRDANGQPYKKKQWVDCAYFNVENPEALAKLLTKGTQVHAKGWPESKVHIKQNGDPVGVQYLKVRSMEILSIKKKDTTS